MKKNVVTFAAALVAALVGADGEPTSHAKLCLVQSEQCFTLSANKEDSNLHFFFGLNPKAERIPGPQGGSLIFFAGTFFGGGSGALDKLALLQYGSDGTIVHLLPEIRLTDQSERRMASPTSLQNACRHHSRLHLG